MRAKLGFAILLLIVVGLTFSVFNAIGQEVQSETDIVFGFRLQTDMRFYLQVGAMVEDADIMAGIGWNNSIWIGAHKYFYSNEEISVFSGIELGVVYPGGQPLEFHPALPLGFAITTRQTTFIVEALILPSVTGEQVSALFAVSFLFRL